MTIEQLKSEKHNAELIHERELKKIYIKYALANNPHQIGDIISDHNGSLKIEKIKVFISFGESECIYEGISLDQKGKPTKKQGRNIYQSNIQTT